MPQTQSNRLRAHPVSIRAGNRRAAVSQWAQKKRFIPVFIIALVFVLFSLIYVWSNHQIINLGYAISELHKEKDVLENTRREYKLELANLTALDRLELLAKTKLGMVHPSPDQVQVIE